MTDKNGSIFVIDDDSFALSYMEELLVAEGYEIHLYPSAEDANKELLRLNPDMILLDLNLKGMSGLMFLKLLKTNEKTEHFPVIMLTSESSSAEMIEAFHLGIADYITKPIQREVFLARLYNHVKLSRYNRLFAQRTAEKLIESERQLKAANENLNIYNAELERLALALQDNDAMLCESNLELEKAKVQAEESDRLKAAFLANVSHEIRTPMNAIMGFVSLLSKPVVDDSSRLKYADIIKKSGQHLLELINNIIDLSKIDAGQADIDLEACNVEQLFNDIYEMFQSAKSSELKSHIEILKQVPSFSHDILLDTTRIKQVLINLMGNAMRFTEKGSIELGCRQQENHLVCYVKDTGIGIPEESKQLIFERFRQAKGQDKRKFGGTGLGLAIAKECVAMHGGTMWFESEEGKGTCFYFTIPFKKSEKQAVSLKPDNAELNLLGKRVLIVDDDRSSVELLRIFFEPFGVMAQSVTTAEEMFELIDEFNPSVILMDIQLPGMSGWEATQKIKEHRPNTKVIIQTAYAFNKDRERSRKVGADGYLPKPIEQDVLMEKIAEVLQ